MDIPASHDQLFPLPPRSAHAALRQHQRNLRDRDLAYVLAHGATYCRTGVTFTVLRERDIPVADRRETRGHQLVGTTVLVAGDGTVVTVYRNRRGVRRVARKDAHRRPP